MVSVVVETTSISVGIEGRRPARDTVHAAERYGPAARGIFANTPTEADGRRVLGDAGAACRAALASQGSRNRPAGLCADRETGVSHPL